MCEYMASWTYLLIKLQRPHYISAREWRTLLGSESSSYHQSTAQSCGVPSHSSLETAPRTAPGYRDVAPDVLRRLCLSSGGAHVLAPCVRFDTSVEELHPGRWKPSGWLLKERRRFEFLSCVVYQGATYTTVEIHGLFSSI